MSGATSPFHVVTTEQLARALAYGRRGWKVFPCEVNGKKPLGRLAPHGVLDATSDATHIEQWWSDTPDANIGIATGTSGFFAVDIDAQHGGVASWRKLTADVGEPHTASVRTPSGGHHLYFAMPSGTIRNSVGKIAPGVDVRATGGYVVAPGSETGSGRYAWTASSTVRPAPTWLLDLLVEPTPNATPVDHDGDENKIPSGRRNDTLLRIAGAMRRHGVSADAIEAALLADNRRRCDPPLAEAEVRTIAASVGRYAPADENDTGPDTRERRLACAIEAERIKREAKRQVDADARGVMALPDGVTVRDLLARPEPTMRWRIEGWQPMHSRVILAAQFKAGKTTLTDNLIRALVDGDPFLDRFAVAPVDGRIGLLDSEMNELLLKQWFAAQHIAHDDRVRVWAMQGKAATFNVLDAHIRAAWVAKFRSCGIRYLIVDCLRPVLDALGLDEHHDCGRFLVALDALLVEAGIGDALVVHHMGHSGERSRGDSRLRDWPDAEWRLLRQNENPASRRSITAYGRDVDVPEAQLHYDPTSRRLTVAGGSRHDKVLQAIVAALTSAGGKHSRKDIHDLLKGGGFSRDQIDGGLQHGRDTGRLQFEGGSNNSTLHWVPRVQ